MEFFAKLSDRIGNNLVDSNVIEAEDAELYIYGVNQIFVTLLNLLSALIIGVIFGKLVEIAVFMMAYIPLRSFAGGYHARTPQRCYFFSVILLIVVSISMKYLSLSVWVYYVAWFLSALIVITLAPVEDKNKPLDNIENKVYRKRAVLIAMAEVLIGIAFEVLDMQFLLISIVYSFVVLSSMLVIGKIKNLFV